MEDLGRVVEGRVRKAAGKGFARLFGLMVAGEAEVVACWRRLEEGKLGKVRCKRRGG